MPESEVSDGFPRRIPPMLAVPATEIPAAGVSVGGGVQVGRRARGGLCVRGEAAAAVAQWPGHDPGLSRNWPGLARQAGASGRWSWTGRSPRSPGAVPSFAALQRRMHVPRARPAPAGRRPGDLPGLRHHGPGRDAPDPASPMRTAGPSSKRSGWPASRCTCRRRFPAGAGRARGEHPRRPGGRRGQAPGFPLPPGTPFGRVAEDQEPAGPGRDRGRYQPGARTPGRADRLAARRRLRAGRPRPTPAGSAPASPAWNWGGWNSCSRRCAGTARHSPGRCHRPRPAT